MVDKKSATNIIPCCDHQRKTCLRVEQDASRTKFIPLDVMQGLQVLELPSTEFDRRYQPMENYPAEKAAQLYLAYSQNIGATTEALKYLGQVINVTEQEYKMATAKKETAAKAVEEKKVASKAAGKSKPVATKPVKAGRRETDAVMVPSKPVKVASNGVKRPSAAQMFQDLLVQGKLTDDQIFEKVQGEYGLDEKKRGYVKWYRNHLKKQGIQVPEAKI